MNKIERLTAKAIKLQREVDQLKDYRKNNVI